MMMVMSGQDFKSLAEGGSGQRLTVYFPEVVLWGVLSILGPI